MLDRVNIGVLIFLFISFLCVPQITATLKPSLDTLPVKLLAVIILLASVTVNRYVALGTFLLIVAIYIEHHHGDIVDVMGSDNNMSAYGSLNKHSGIMRKLDQGGNADETYDTDNFMSKEEDQDNEFKPVDSSMDEKHALNSEPLGTKAEGLFPDDAKHVNAMEHGNKNGYSE
jgi:hypothetical protein